MDDKLIYTSNYDQYNNPFFQEKKMDTARLVFIVTTREGGYWTEIYTSTQRFFIELIVSKLYYQYFFLSLKEEVLFIIIGYPFNTQFNVSFHLIE